MDEIIRWRSLAHWNSYLYPGNSIRYRSKKRLPKHPHGTILDSIKGGTTHCPPRSKLTSVMDKLVKDQKDYVKGSGEVNHNVINARMKEKTTLHSHGQRDKMESSRGKVVKNKPKRKESILQSEDNQYVTKQLELVKERQDKEKEQDPDKIALNEAGQGDYVALTELLGKYDFVKSSTSQIPEKKGETKIPSPSSVLPGIENKKPPATDAKSNGEENILKLEQLLHPKDLDLTLHDKLHTFQQLDSNLVERSKWSYMKTKNIEKSKQLVECYDFIEQELKILGCPEKGPNFGRLKVYSACFNKIIEEFKVYGPLLADIKRVYDEVIQHFETDQNELQFLRTKVQKLLSLNENRLLLKYERKRAKALEEHCRKIQEENESLKKDLQRKIGVYSAYVPLSPTKKETPVTSSNPSLAEPPTKVYEEQLESMKNQLQQRKEEIDKLRKEFDQSVPVSVKAQLEEDLRIADERLAGLKELNEQLELDVQKKETELAECEEVLQQKEKAYSMLMREYNELSEAAALSLQAQSGNKYTPE